jgi:hypothetical protein
VHPVVQKVLGYSIPDDNKMPMPWFTFSFSNSFLAVMVTEEVVAAAGVVKSGQIAISR